MLYYARDVMPAEAWLRVGRGSIRGQRSLLLTLGPNGGMRFAFRPTRVGGHGAPRVSVEGRRYKSVPPARNAWLAITKTSLARGVAN